MDEVILQTKNKIEKIIETVTNDKECFEKYLILSSSLYNFSYYNLILIYKQYPEATTIAGYTTWTNVFDSEIKQNEKPIFIFVPALKDKELQYVTQPVFDIKQTTCNIDNTYKIKEALEYIMPSLKDISGIDFIPAEEEKVPTYLNSPITNEIFYNATLSEKDIAANLIKAYINTLSDDKIKNNYISYVVLKHFNLPINNISFVFLKSIQNKPIEEKEDFLNDIQKTSCEVIEKLKESIEEKIKYVQLNNKKSFSKR